MKIIKKTYIYLLLVVTSIALIGGCEKDPFNLDLKPPSMLTDASYWEKPGHWASLMNGIHHRLRVDQWDFILLGECRGGHFSVQPYGGHTRSHSSIVDNSLSVENTGISSYGGFYYTINQLNLIIDKTEDGAANDILTESQVNRYLGQAYGIRAFYYFHMVRTWGDVILKRKPSYGFEIGELSRSQDPASEVMTFIEEDIERSLSHFEDYSFGKGKHHWSKAATQMLKAEYYLWTAHRDGGTTDAEIAQAALEDIQTNIPSLGLETNFQDIFDQDNKGNEEIIFTIRNKEDEYTLFGGSIHNLVIRDRMVPDNGFDSLTGQHITIEDYNIHSRGGRFSVALRTDVFNSFRNDDTRKWASAQGMWHEVNGDTVMISGAIWQNKYQGVIIGGLRTWYNDLPVYRYADLLLLLAEAKFLSGEDPTDEINTIRERAFAGNYDETVHGFGNMAIDNNWKYALLRERKFEFLYEGKRWYDLRRFGYDFVEELGITNVSSDQLLWPIDRGTLTDNSQLKQTPGY